MASTGRAPSTQPQAVGAARARRRKIRPLPYLLLLPSLILVSVLLLWPTLDAIIMSFHNWDLFGNVKEHYFLGLRNYRNLFDNPAVSQSLITTAVFTVVSIALEFLIGLCAALLVHPAFPGRRAARTILLVPWAIPFVPWSLALMLFVGQHGVCEHSRTGSAGIHTDARFSRAGSLPCPTSLPAIR